MTPGNYNSDWADMFAVHEALLTELRAAPAYVGRAGQNVEQVATIGSFYENLIEMLHVHHMSEDELLYPILEQRCPESRAALTRIDDQHKLLPAPMARARQAIAAWRESPSVDHGRAVIETTAAIIAVLEPHLREEESTVVPLAARWISQEELGRLGPHSTNAFRGDKPWLMLGLVREHLDQAHRDGMLAHMPPQKRTGWLVEVEPMFEAFVGRVRG
jgi:hemerythrin-like domain-containing protein